MTVDYRIRMPPSPPARIRELEQLVGRPLPPDYRDYLQHQDGGVFVSNDQAVKEVFAIGDLPDDMDWLDLWGTLRTYQDRVPGWLLPVAADEYGNLFALSLRGHDHGSVWLWNHEEEADEDEPPTEDNLTLVAPDWSSFVGRLQPPSS